MAIPTDGFVSFIILEALNKSPLRGRQRPPITQNDCLDDVLVSLQPDTPLHIQLCIHTEFICYLFITHLL